MITKFKQIIQQNLNKQITNKHFSNHPTSQFSSQISIANTDSRFSNRNKCVQRTKQTSNRKYKTHSSSSKRYQQKLSQLQSIKKTSNDIKEKNKLTQHRNFWVKEFKYLSRLQRDMELQLTNYFDIFDRYFQQEISQRQVFKNTQYKNYSQLREQISQNLNRFQAQTYRQVQSLPLLAQKVNKTQKKQIKKVQILQILADISRVLAKIDQQNKMLQQRLTLPQQSSSRVIQSKIEAQQQQNFHQHISQQQQQQYSVFSSVGLIRQSKQIKGFDMQKQSIRKLHQSQSNLIQYLQLFNDKLSQDQIYEVINEFNRVNRLLRETFQLEKEKLQLDYQDALKISNELIETSDSFNKISHIYATYIGRGKSIQLYYERLGIQFPKIGRRQLQAVTSYIEARIYKEKKLNSMKRNFYKQKQDLFAKVDKQIHIRIQRKIQKQKKKAQQLQRKQQKLKLQKQLEILRQDFNKRMDQKQKIKKQQQQLMKQTQRKKQAIRRLYLDELSKKADQVSAVKTQKQLQQQKLLQIAKEKEEQEKKKLLIQNKPKVQLRQSIERRKIQKKVQEREYKEKLPEIEAQRIKNAIENYNFRPKIEFDKQRLNKPTQAMIKRKQTFMDKADKVLLSKMTGYNINQLMSDMRYKVNMALQQAGLSNTDYARELLVSMSKRPN